MSILIEKTKTVEINSEQKRETLIFLQITE